MNSETRSYRNTAIILILAGIAAIIYLISIKTAYPVFQNTRLLEPLAELSSLFPLYYLSLAIMASLGVICFILRVKNKAIHVLILLLLAVMLWFTRYYLAGFTWEPDSARNLGVSLYIPEILNGFKFQYSSYGAEFPVSYILEYTIFNATGASYETYFNLMPLINIIMFTILCYAFVSRLFSPLTAFLTTFVAMPGMHYIIFIMGAHTIGVLLLLTILVMVWKRGAAWRILTFALIPVIIITHPVSPLLLWVFLGAGLVVYMTRRKSKIQITMAAMLVVCILGWFIWPTISVVSYPENIISPADSSFAEWFQGEQRNVLPQDLTTATQFAFGRAFIYESIFNINRIIYLLYGLLSVTAVVFVLARTWRQKISWKHFMRRLGGMTRKQLFMILSLMVLVLLAILLSQRTHDLIERALTFAILTMSAVFVSTLSIYYFRIKKNCRKIVAGGMTLILLFLTLSFPLVAYSIDAYSSFPASEKAGLEFVSDNISLSDKELICSFGQQIILFQPEVKSVRNAISPRALESGDVFVIRQTGYYYAAMRFDFSYEENRIARHRQALTESTGVNHIYYNPTTAVFLKRN